MSMVYEFSGLGSMEEEKILSCNFYLLKVKWIPNYRKLDAAVRKLILLVTRGFLFGRSMFVEKEL